MSLQTSWERKKGEITHYIRINHLFVIIGSHAGSGHTDNAGTCSHEDFLNDSLRGRQFQASIQREFGDDLLTAVIAAVQSAKTNPAFIAKHKKSNAALAMLERIPLDPALADLPTHPDTENGGYNYGNGGGYKTVLRSDTVTFTVERNEGVVTDANGEKRPFILPGHASDAVALHDHLYIVVSDDYAVIGPDGSLLTPETGQSSVFGTFLRISSVYRRNETVCFRYFWLQGEHPQGWLRYELGVGFNGRWQKS